MGNNFTAVLISFVWMVVWMTGVVLAKGFWSTFIALCTGGMYSMYLIIELVLTKYQIM